MKDEIQTATQYNYNELLERTGWKGKLAINLGLALIGVAVVILASHPLLQLVGGVWAAFNALPIVQWGLDL